ELVETGYTEPIDAATLVGNELKVWKETRKKDKTTLYLLYKAVDELGFEKIVGAKTSKEMWDILERELKESKDLNVLTIDELAGSLEAHEQRKKKKKQETLEEALQTKVVIEEDKVLYSQSSCGRGRGHGGRGNDRVVQGHGQESVFDEIGEKSQQNWKFGHIARDCFVEKKVEENTNLVTEEEVKDEFLLMANINTNIDSESIWYLDTGACNHMCGHKHLFKELQVIKYGHVSFGDASKVQVKGREKSEAFEVFKKFKVMVEKTTSKFIKALQSDRGGKYVSTNFMNLCEEQGIRRCPHAKLENKTPQEAWSGRKPIVAHFKVFGSVAYGHIPDQRRTKLDDKSKKFVFIGYDEKTKGYKLMDPINKKVMVNRDVIVEEDYEWDWKKSMEPAVVELGKTTSIAELTNNGTNTSNDLPSSDDEAEPRIQRTRTLQELYDSTGEKWKTAIDEEIKAIERNKTWDLVELPSGTQPIGFKWVFTKKMNAQGEIERNEKKVLKLKKALYGLKQAPRAWNTRIDTYFKENKFKKFPYEHALYVKKNEGNVLFVALYVDDLIFVGNNKQMIKDFKEVMTREFEMTDLGMMNYFLGLEVIQGESGIFLSQEAYAKEILKKKYVATSLCVSHAIWLRNLLIEMENQQHEATQIRVDNKSAIELAKNPVNHERSKHIDIRFHFIRDHVKEGRVQLVHVPSHDQVANIFTKPLPTVLLKNCKRMIDMKDRRELSLRSGVENKLN
ncbi:retrovirus-related pol polyprotein from transposon TNT 1-94, partial [Tanacetum coccineum]